MLEDHTPGEEGGLETTFLPHSSSSPPPSLLQWIIHLSLSTSFGVLAVLGYIYTNNSWYTFQAKDYVCAFITFLPIVTLEVLLSIRSIRAYITQKMLAFRFPTLPMSCFLTLLFIIAGLFYKKFQLFQISIFFGYCAVCLGAAMLPQKYNMAKKDSILIHLLIFFILGWALDFRWFQSLLTVPGSLSYDWWALAITVLGVGCWGLFSEISDFGYTMWPIRWQELMWAVIGFLPFLAIIIPIGLVSDFLKWNPNAESFQQVGSFWIENFTTVAITEEVYFRAALLNLIHEVYPTKRKWLAIVLSSLAFGLWHTPRRTDIVEQIIYILLSFIAGGIYSGVYIYGGNNILGASITHSVVDTVWEFLLRN